jgi:hypothetical protein
MAQMKETETKDEIVLETRKIKEALARSEDFDVDRIIKIAKRKQGESGRKIIPPPVRHGS